MGGDREQITVEFASAARVKVKAQPHLLLEGRRILVHAAWWTSYAPSRGAPVVRRRERKPELLPTLHGAEVGEDGSLLEDGQAEV